MDIKDNIEELERRVDDLEDDNDNLRGHIIELQKAVETIRQNAQATS